MMDDRPIVAEPEQHYWRRKANRKVRKARLTQRLRHWSAGAFALAIVTVAMFQAGAHAVNEIRATPVLAVEHIEIAGGRRAGEEALRGRLAGFLGASIVDVNLYEVAAAAAGDPWVLHASAKRILPDTLRVEVLERRPAAVARIDGRFWVVDETGFVVAPGRRDDLPVLAGLDGLDRDVLEQRLRHGALAVAALRRAAPAWLSGIEELHLGGADRVEARTGPDGPTILLDPRRVERNLGAYLALAREIEERSGVPASVDLRWRDRISVIPGQSKEDS
jgi:hypothetical protein